MGPGVARKAGNWQAAHADFFHVVLIRLASAAAIGFACLPPSKLRGAVCGACQSRLARAAVLHDLTSHPSSF